MLYGKPEYNIEDDQTDQVGLRTLVMSKFWAVSRWPMSIEQLDAEGPEPPEVPGGMGLVGKQMRRNGGGLRTFWHFEGINGDGKSVTFKTRGNSPHYGFEPGFAEVSILRHPRIESMLDEFDGQLIDNQIIWPRVLSAGRQGRTGLDTSTQEKINPLFGRDSYFSMQGGTYWYRYMAQDERAIPPIEGKIFSAGSLPGRARSVPGRNYLGVGAPYTRRGPAAIEVMEQYWLSDEGGWPKEIYGRPTQQASVQSGL